MTEQEESELLTGKVKAARGIKYEFPEERYEIQDGQEEYDNTLPLILLVAFVVAMILFVRTYL